MALAYLDARDVRHRLNEVVGPENWSCEHYDCGGGKLGCRLSIRIGDEWITKTDGAGDTQVEAEKGAFSAALKRAAVAWGVGEYLYDLGNTWVPCESQERNGKPMFKKFTADPWDSVPREFRSETSKRQEPPADLDAERKQATLVKRLNEKCDEIVKAIESAVDGKALDAVWNYHSNPTNGAKQGAIPFFEEQENKAWINRINAAYNKQAESFNQLAAG